VHYLLIVGALLFFAFIAPVTITLGLALAFALVTGVVALTTKLVSGVETTIGSAAKAACLAFALLALALFTLISFSSGTGIQQFSGIPALALLAACMLSYSLGFKLALGVPMGSSIVIAGISTVVSAIALPLLKGVINA
jgi:hypothetical protein